jgi:hypothetical protein
MHLFVFIIENTPIEFAMLIWALQKYVMILYIVKYLIEILTLFNGPLFI